MSSSLMKTYSVGTRRQVGRLLTSACCYLESLSSHSAEVEDQPSVAARQGVGKRSRLEMRPSYTLLALNAAEELPPLKARMEP